VKYIIIGAVAGGASTAARLRRLDEHAEIIMFEKGEYISYANCGLPYYIGNIIKDRDKLFVQSPASFATRFKVDVRTNSLVNAISATEKNITVTNLISGKTYQETYDKLILSPGANPIVPPLSGIHEEGIFTVRNVQDTDRIKHYITAKKAKTAVVIGAGFIGLEMAENFHELGLEVSIVEMGNQILAPVDFPIAAIAQKHLREKGLHLFLNTQVTGFEKVNQNIHVHLKDKAPLIADIVILAIGVKPDTQLAETAQLRIGDAKGIWVNEYLQTSDPDIYAVGDAVEFENPISQQASLSLLAGPANKQGRICANNIVLGNQQLYRGSIQTAIVKLFDLTAATAGIAVKHLQKLKIPHLTSIIHGNSHAGYYPDAQLMTIQIAFSPDDGKLLSAQIIGKEGVDKRIDLLAQVIKNEGTIYDLMEIEHAYAPPYSSTKDPVNMAGFTAENILLGRLKTISIDEFMALKDEHVLIDVRTPQEFEQGSMVNAMNIPLDEIRTKLHQVPKDKSVYIFCQQGMRGYLAQRILTQHGFENISNLSGGYLLWKICKDEKSL
jgi:NADPH-dependent 2,4-dienoyl-CoA reductase/sulfur reductase-like enzyme/rhodanese-related sulfurtransferase